MLRVYEILCKFISCLRFQKSCFIISQRSFKHILLTACIESYYSILYAYLLSGFTFPENVYILHAVVSCQGYYTDFRLLPQKEKTDLYYVAYGSPRFIMVYPGRQCRDDRLRACNSMSTHGISFSPWLWRCIYATQD